MDDYNRGKRDIMLEMANDDLVDVASRIAVLEHDLDNDLKMTYTVYVE